MNSSVKSLAQVLKVLSKEASNPEKNFCPTDPRIIYANLFSTRIWDSVSMPPSQII